MKSIEERAYEYAERHQLAELELRGLGAVYGYQRIYNAEKVAYERGAEEQKAIDIEKFKSKLKSIMIIAQDPTMHQERKEMEILAMIQNSLEE